MKKNKILSIIAVVSSILCSQVAINNKVFSKVNVQYNEVETWFDEGIRQGLDRFISNLAVNKIENSLSETLGHFWS